MTAVLTSERAGKTTGSSSALPVSFRGLRRTFGTGDAARTVLRDVTFDVAAGEVLAILGTVRLRQVNPAARGRRPGLPQRRFRGHRTDSAVQGIDPRCAFAFQEPRLLPWHTLQANVAIGLPTGCSAKDGKAKVSRLLELVGLDSFAKHRPREVSGGMAQRASLARALARNPGVLLLDEPFGALDALTRHQDAGPAPGRPPAEPTTVLLVTHDVDEALQLADRIIVLGSVPTAASGATIVRTVDVPGSRPRDRASAELARLRASLLASLGVDGHRRPQLPARHGPPGHDPRRSPTNAPARRSHYPQPELAPSAPSAQRNTMQHARPFTRRSLLGGSRRGRRLGPGADRLRRRRGLAGQAAAAGSTAGGTLNIDFATYNPLSLVIKDQGWLEASLKDQGVTVNWIQSAGSNKANEALRSGAIDVGSTAGSAALLARSNGSPIQAINIYSQPEWAALVAADGLGHHVRRRPQGQVRRRHQGHRPVLLPAAVPRGGRTDARRRDRAEPAARRRPRGPGERLRARRGPAWTRSWPVPSRRAPTLFYRNLDFNTYGFLNATESFLKDKPELAQTVVNAYEKARAWAADNPEETAQILADVAGLDLAVAKTVVLERTNLDVDPAPGEAQRKVLEKIGPIFVETGDVTDQQQIDDAVATLLDDSLVKKADPSAIKGS